MYLHILQIITYSCFFPMFGFFLNAYFYLCVCECPRPDPQELEQQAVVSYPIVGAGLQPLSSERLVSTLTTEPDLQPPHSLDFLLIN